jgi:hypothetical protein
VLWGYHERVRQSRAHATRGLLTWWLRAKERDRGKGQGSQVPFKDLPPTGPHL